MEELLNALSGIIYKTFRGLRCLYQIRTGSRMRGKKIKRMQYTRDFVRLALSSAVALKEDSRRNPEEARQMFGELGKRLALEIYDLSVEKQKQIISSEADRNRACSES